MAEEEKGVHLTSKSVATMIGVITLIVTIYQGISTINGYAFELRKVQSDTVELGSAVDHLNSKIDILNEKLVQLTIALNRNQDKLEQLQGDKSN